MVLGIQNTTNPHKYGNTFLMEDVGHFYIAHTTMIVNIECLSVASRTGCVQRTTRQGILSRAIP